MYRKGYKMVLVKVSYPVGWQSLQLTCGGRRIQIHQCRLRKICRLVMITNANNVISSFSESVSTDLKNNLLFSIILY